MQTAGSELWVLTIHAYASTDRRSPKKGLVVGIIEKLNEANQPSYSQVSELLATAAVCIHSYKLFVFLTSQEFVCVFPL